MRVNFAFKGFRDNRLVVGLVMLAIFFIASSFTKPSDRDLRARQVNLIIREIGHRLLLQAGDLTSRVLPVTEIKEGTFLLTFENEFVFSHDSLMALTEHWFPKTQFPSGYTVTVHECITAGIVYGFQVNHTSPDILGCRGRREPAGCYTIEIAFPDLYKNIGPKKADIDQPTEELNSSEVDPGEVNAIPPDSYREDIGIEELRSLKIELQEANAKIEELKSFNVDSREAIAKLEALKSFKVDPQVASAKPEEFKTTTFAYPLINLVYSGMLVLLGVTLLIGRFGKRLVPVPANQDHTILKESVPEVSALGKFLFDLKEQRLLLGSEVISLTDKECKVLELLNRNFGQLISRETLMQEVWINEGVITGRSLDMFVSKLRKKLSRDPELSITNVHGKGYKLEIPGIEIL